MDSSSFINCIRCKLEYDDSRRQPRVLSCLHTCCNSCLEQQAANRIIVCADCNTQSELPADGVSGIPIDTACRNYLDFIRVQRSPAEIACTDCPDDATASTFCKDCFNFMCPECTSAHRRTQVTRKHTVVTLGEIKESGMREFHRKDTCNKQGHEEQVYTFYCDRRGCDVPVCTLCAVCDHNQTNGHLIRNLSDVYEDSKAVVQSVVREINAKGTPMSEAVEQLENVVDELAATESEIDQEIDIIFDKYQKILNERRYHLHMEVQNHCQVKKRDLQEKVRNLKSYTTDVKSATDFTNRVLLYTTATEFLNLKQIILRRILELKNLNVSIPARDDVALRFVRGVSDESFMQLINGIGNVTSKESSTSNQKQLLNGYSEPKQSPQNLSPIPDRQVVAPPSSIQMQTEPQNMVPQHNQLERHFSAPLTSERNPLQRQASVPITVEDKNVRRQNISSTVAMMNGLPSNSSPGTNEKKSFFAKAKVPEQTDAEESNERRHRPSPLKIESSGNPVGLGDFLRNLELKGELPMKKSEKQLQSSPRESFQQLSPDRPFQPVTSPISPKMPTTPTTPSGISPELQSIPGVIYGDVICPEFTFDVLTIHSEREVSLDGKVLRNRKTGKPCSSAAAEKQLQHYKGIIGNFAFNSPGKYYYEIDVNFTIYQPLEQTWLVFELGICRKGDIDTHHTVERHEHARSCYVARYPEDGKLAHEFWHNRDLLTFVPLCENSAGVTMEVTYGLIVDTKRKKWTVADVKKQKKLHTFTGIDFSEPMWPVFGTYNPDLVSVEMTLRSGNEIPAFPPFLKGF